MYKALRFVDALLGKMKDEALDFEVVDIDRDDRSTLRDEVNRDAMSFLEY
jgi:hypothetical protein